MRWLLPLLFTGCATMRPAAIPVPIEIRPLAPPRPERDVVRFAEGAAPPEGCFARSRRTGAVACVTGHFVPHGSGERRFAILENYDGFTAPLDLAGGPVLAEESRKALNERLGAGEHVALTIPAVRVELGAANVFGPFRTRDREEEHPTRSPPRP